MSPLSAKDGGEGDRKRENVRMVTNREVWISVHWELVVNHPHYTLISMEITPPLSRGRSHLLSMGTSHTYCTSEPGWGNFEPTDF